MMWSLDWIEETARRELVIRALISNPSPYNNGWDRSVKIGIVTLADSLRGVFLYYENNWWPKRSGLHGSSIDLTFACEGSDPGTAIIGPFMRLPWLGREMKQRRSTIVLATVPPLSNAAPSHPLVMGEFARITGRVEDRLGEEMARLKRQTLEALLYRLEHFYHSITRDITQPLGLMP